MRALAVLLLALAGCASAPAPVAAPEVRRAEAALRLGVQARGNDQWARAAELFTEAGRLARSIDHGRLEALAELNLAWLETRTAKADAARARLGRLTVSPALDAATRAEAAYRLARLESGEHRTDAARRWLERAEGIDPALAGSARVLLLRARLLAGGGEGEAALALARRVAGDAADRAAAAQLEARLLLDADRAEAALERLAPAYEVFRERAESAALAENLLLQAEARRRLGQAEQADALERRGRSVCSAWLERFSGEGEWRPRACPTP